MPILASPAVTAGGVWGAWTTTYTTTSNGTTVLQATVWDTWYTSTTTTYTTVHSDPDDGPVGLTAAEADRQADWERRCRERDEAEAAAAVRSEALLRMVLSPEELAHYEDTCHIVVTGSQGNRYEIGHGIIGNVFQLDDAGEVVASLCCHPRGNVPHRDSHAAQVLALRNDEELFRATANIEQIRRQRPARRQMAA